MRRWLALLLGAGLLCAGVLYAGAAPGEWRSAYQIRRRAAELAQAADVMVLAEVGEQVLPSYPAEGRVYTDTVVSVVRGGGFAAGTELTLRLPGGRTDDLEVIVDYLHPFPDKGGQVFLLLKEAGEKYDVLAFMELVDGRPRWPEGRAYMRYLSQLE
ncbi:hypothetical protein [Symbiobacterium thermophilum]|nr:hypothetical protein [Symbiobacterium thermophilum]